MSDIFRFLFLIFNVTLYLIYNGYLKVLFMRVKTMLKMYQKCVHHLDVIF